MGQRWGASGAHEEDPTGGLGQGTSGGAHVEHPAHVRDAGCVEAQRLVERRRILPSRKGGIRCGCGARCGPGGERALGGGGASGMHGKGLAQGWRRAHLKHAVHVRDAGRVEGQRLVKRPRVLPSRKEGMYDAGRGVGREGAGCRAAAAAQAVCTGRARLLKAVGSIGTRGADPKHLVHAPDLGHVEAQRLVESHRVLPSRKEGIRCDGEVRAAEAAGRGAGAAQAARGGRACLKPGIAGRARSARRTCLPWP